jgi:hypothetical protein
MALIDYRKLCPRSGHVLTRDERNALGVGVGPSRAAPRVRCETCGRDVDLVVHPGTGRSLLYPMHVKTCTLGPRDATAGHTPRGS